MIGSDEYILPSQLCIGLHVHLDLGWTDHPFTFSNFKIKSLDQVATLQGLGLERIRYTPAKSDGRPLDAPAAEDAPAPAPAPAEDPAFQAKRERIARLAQQRSRVAACEKAFVSSVQAVKGITANLYARPEQARDDALALVKVIADSMLTDADVAVNLMKDKIGGEETYLHSLNVTMLCMMLAKEMKAPPEAIRVLGMGALMHDIGKSEVPNRIQKKTSALTRHEVAALRQHVAFGVKLGQHLGLSQEVLTIVAQHHECVDGSGYPGALAGNAVSMLARILAVVNVFDNLCNPPNPFMAQTPHEALSTMYGQQRAKFELLPLNTFIRCMGVYPPGTLVALSNEEVGIVVSVNSARPMKPTVLVHDADIPRDQAILVELEREPDVAIVRALRPQQLPDDVREYLSPRTRMSYYFDSEEGAGK
jgi:putative nucleotidyltransferase with HDIG domain